MARSIVETQLEALSVRGQTVNVDHLRGDLLGRLSIEKLTVEDAGGVWFSGEDVTLNWSPFGLLFGDLKINRLEAEEINVQRRPVLLPAPTSSGGNPIERYRLGALELGRLNLANGVAGPAQSYAISGQLDAKGMAGDVSLDLRPTATFGDKVHADVSWGGEIPIQGQLNIDSMPGGLVAALLQLPADQALSAKMEASGGELDWDVTVLATVAGAEVLDFDVKRDQFGYDASGSLTLTPFGRFESLQPRLGERLDVSGNLALDDRFTVDAITDRGRLQVSGLLAESGEAIRLEDVKLAATELNAPAISGLENLDLKSAQADGRFEMRNGVILFDGDLSAPALRYSEYGARDIVSRGQHAWENGTVVLATDLTLSRPSGLSQSVLSRLGSRVAVGLDARYAVAEKRADLAAFSLRSGGQSFSGNGSYDVGGAIDLSGEAALADIAPLNEVTGTWRARGASLSDLALSFRGEAVPGDQLDQLKSLIGDRAELVVDLQRQGRHVLVQSAAIQNDVMTVAVSGSLRGDEVDLKGSLSTGPLGLSAIAATPVSAKFSIDGLVQSPRFVANGFAERVSVEGQTLLSSNLSIDAHISSSPEFQIELDSTYLDDPLDVALQGGFNAEILSITNLEARWADLILTGQGSIDATAPNMSSFALNISGSAPLVQNVGGQVSYAAEFLAADISVSELSLGPADVRTTRLRASGAWPSFEGTLDYEGEIPFWSGEEVIQGAQTFEVNALDQTIVLSGNTRFAGQEFEITSPVQVGLAPTLYVQGGLSAFGGDIELTFDQSGQSISKIRATDLVMGKLGALIQRPGVNGRLTGEAEVSIDPSGLNGQGVFRVTDLSRGDSERANLDLRASVTDSALSARLIANGQDEVLSLAGTLETLLTHKGGLTSVRIVDTAPVPVRLKGGGSIAPLWALAAPSDLRFEGLFDVDLSNGDGRDFKFTGPVSLQDGIFEDGFTGLHLEEIMAQIDLSEDGIALREANAVGSRGGSLEASGDYTFDGDGDIILELNRLNALNRSDVSAEISGSARVDRRSRRTHVDGDLRVDEAKINLSKLPSAGYTTLDVVFVEPGDELAQDGPIREAISLDLELSADRRIFVTGPGVDTEWGLDARVTGPLGAPQLAGQASLVRGEADLLSRSYRLTDGAVRFLGDPEDSELTLRADRTSDGITTSIILQGTLTDPEIELSSDPSLPDDEILARALFGRSPSNLSPLQAAQLAGAAAQLAGGDALSLTGQLEAATGLDRLDFGFDDEGAATLSTGKYLADDLYLEIESGGSGAPGVALEWTPLSNVELDAEIDPELGPKVAIQWKRDFDRLPGEKRGDEDPARSSSTE